MVAALSVLAGAGILALAGWRRWLTPGGLAAALPVGAGVWAGTGSTGLLLLLLFLVSASVLTGIGGSGDRSGRGAAQVVSNGGAAAACGLAGWAGLLPGAEAAVVGAIAAATSDTWASEVGRAAAGPTRLASSWERVEPGHPGGVSTAGTASALAGALLLGTAAGVLDPAGGYGRWIATAVAGGAGGTAVDSLLGASVESRVESFGNDHVNGCATLLGAGLGWLIGA